MLPEEVLNARITAARFEAERQFAKSILQSVEQNGLNTLAVKTICVILNIKGAFKYAHSKLAKDERIQIVGCRATIRIVEELLNDIPTNTYRPVYSLRNKLFIVVYLLDKPPYALHAYDFNGYHAHTLTEALKANSDPVLEPIVKSDPQPQRLTKEHIDSLITNVEYDVNPQVIVCKLYVGDAVIVGTSYCFSKSSFDPERGKKSAYDDAIKQLFDLEAYHLKRLRTKPD